MNEEVTDVSTLKDSALVKVKVKCMCTWRYRYPANLGTMKNTNKNGGATTMQQ